MIDDQGATLYEHLLHLRKAHGITDPRLITQPLPACAEWIHSQFWRLSRRRSFTQYGAAQPISYAEIETLERLNRMPFTQFDIEAIERMDAAYLSALNTTKRG